MNFEIITTLTKQLRTLRFALRNDRQAMLQFRLLLMGLLTCVAFYYAGYTILIEPGQHKLSQRKTQLHELQNLGIRPTSPEEALHVSQMKSRKERLVEEIAVLTFRRKMLLEQGRSQGNPERFQKIIFTMNENAPVDMENILSRMSIAEKRSTDLYQEYPASLEGQGKYHDFISYLRYIEKTPEISAIDNLTLDRIEPGQNIHPGSVSFSLKVSRILLQETP
ncbi:MAG: hypothetical protein KJ950_12140 [Proteobacteria bacterium]|nr:hypothetical protein [Pseudomonadota bacterium]MBU1688082.1 hypothetical protein [Pseudomonadota bacterium]